MAKPTGFLQFAREVGAERDLLARVRDWQPIHLHLPDERLQSQAARCMDCGIPFCHKGRVLNRMTSGCPINNLIPEWNDLVYRGLWREAYERLAKTNNFPEFTGLVCPAPCEAACTLGISEPSVTIKSIEFAIIEKAFAAGWIKPNHPQKRSGKRVAVVGSGPAGLACADQLNLVGHAVTVFERADRVGGLLMYGIPNMKLDKKVVQRRVDLMAAAGITFVLNTEIGIEMPAARLRQEFEAIVLCTGATKPRDLPIPGRELKGVHFAMEFLEPGTKKILGYGDIARPISPYPFISAAGKDVIIIGGGDTGTDCVATALRHTCASLTQFEILERPPDARAPDNPWPQWPRVYKQDYGQQEAMAVYGRDPREFGILSKRFIGNGVGEVQAVETVQVRWESNGSGPKLVEIPGTERTWPAQLVLLAMGFLGPEGCLLGQLGIAADEHTYVRAPYGTFHSNVPGIFAAGDARRGQSLVVWAIHEGRGAAREVDRWLMGETDLP